MMTRLFTTLLLLAFAASTTACVSLVAKTSDYNTQTSMVRERTTLVNIHTDRGAIVRLYETGSSDKIPLRVLQVYSSSSHSAR